MNLILYTLNLFNRKRELSVLYSSEHNNEQCEAKLVEATRRQRALISFYQSFVARLKKDSLKMSLGPLKHYVESTIQAYKSLKANYLSSQNQWQQRLEQCKEKEHQDGITRG